MNKLFIKKGDIIKYLDADDIYFFTRENNHTYAITKDETLLINASLNYVNEVMGNDFLRTHKSFLINLNKIDSVPKFTDRTYDINFVGIRRQAYITKENMKILFSKGIVL